MDDKTKKMFLKHTSMQSFKQKVAVARRIIEDALEYYNPYVSYSGGKDSTVVLHLITSFKLDILVIHWDYGSFMPRKYFKEIIDNAKKIGTENLEIYTSDTYKKLGRKAFNVWGKEFFKGVIPKLKKRGYNAAFLGLRKEESITRRKTINKGRSIMGIKEFYPLGDWSFLDVWGYIVLNNLPYHSVYDRYAPVLGWDKARFVTFFDRQFEDIGQPNIDGVLSWRFKNA